MTSAESEPAGPAPFTAPDPGYRAPSPAAPYPAAPYPPPPYPAAPYPALPYPAPPYPPAPGPAQPGAGYAGYGAQPGVYYPGYAYPGYASAPGTNGLAIASMVTSIVGAVTLLCWAGLVLGPVGAILGHVARRQVRQRQERGGGLALTGIIVGWLVTAAAILIVIGYVLLLANGSTADPTVGGFGDVIQRRLGKAGDALRVGNLSVDSFRVDIRGRQR